MKKLFLASIILLFVAVLGGWGEELVIKANLNKGTGNWASVSTSILKDATSVVIRIPVEYRTGLLTLFLRGATIQTNDSKFSAVQKIETGDAALTGIMTAEPVTDGTLLEEANVRLTWAQTLVASSTPIKSAVPTEVDFTPGASSGSLTIYASDFKVQIPTMDYWFVKPYSEWWGGSGQAATFQSQGIATLWRVVATIRNDDTNLFSTSKRDALKNKDVKFGIDPTVLIQEFSRLKQAMGGYSVASGLTAFPTANLYYDKQNPLVLSGISLLDDNDLAGNVAKFFFTGNLTKAAEYKEMLGSTFLASQWTQNYNPLSDGWVSKLTLSMRGLDSKTIVMGSTDFFVVPPTPNLLRSAGLVSVPEVLPLLWENDPQDLAEGLPKRDLAFQWKEAQKIQSILIWTDAGNLKSSNVTVRGKGGQDLTQTIRVDSIPVTFQVKEVKPLAGSPGNWEYGAGTGSRHFYFLELPRREETLDLAISLPATATVYKVAALSALFAPPRQSGLSLVVTSDAQYVFTSQKFSIADVLRITSGTVVPGYTFLDRGYGVEKPGAYGHRDFDEKASPITYAWGGWETPLSYTKKVMTNAFRGKFPTTELDLVKDNPFDVNGVYFSPPTLSSAHANDNFQFTFGLRVPQYPKETLLNPGSPFFVEKWAGVDSLGLLQSAIRMKDDKVGSLAPWTDSAAKDRWYWRTTGTNGSNAWLAMNQIPFVASKQGLSWYTASQIAQWTANNEEWYRKNSDIVGALGSMKVGDILVGYEGSELVTAVILEKPSGLSSSSLQDLRKWMAATKVAVVSRSLGALTFSTWADFTLHPEDYHIRRVNLHTEESKVAFDPKWDIPADSQNTIVFLPNTEELVSVGLPEKDQKDGSWPLMTGRIGTTMALNSLSSSGTSNVVKQWDILSAEDYGFTTNQPLGGNIQNNSHTEFYLVASKDKIDETGLRAGGASSDVLTGLTTNPAYAVVAKFTKDSSTTKDMTVTWIKDDPKYYPGKTNRLLVSGGRFYVEINHNNNLERYDFFGIVALNAVPGDDIKLTFGFEGKPVFQTGRMAVYDKKMLWRANLYVDEGGQNDWNNRHPWVSNNEWNTPDGSIQNPKTGGQIVKIKPWTMYYISNDTVTQIDETIQDTVKRAEALENDLGVFHNPQNLPRIVQGNVAYTTGGNDSPFNFNRKLISQLNALNILRAQETPPGWSTTSAPIEGTESNWNKYAKTKQSTFFPYRPNLSSIRNFMSSSFLSNQGFDAYEAGNYNSFRQSAGIDCIGFLLKTMSYEDNPYAAKDVVNDDTWDNEAGSGWVQQKQGVSDMLKDTYSSLISAPRGNWQDQPANLEYLVPGDFIGWQEHSHVAIVQQITKPASGQALTRFNVSVIHATSGQGNTWRVRVNDWWQRELRNNENSDIWYSDSHKFEARRLR